MVCLSVVRGKCSWQVKFYLTFLTYFGHDAYAMDENNSTKLPCQSPLKYRTILLLHDKRSRNLGNNAVNYYVYTKMCKLKLKRWAGCSLSKEIPSKVFNAYFCLLQTDFAKLCKVWNISLLPVGGDSLEHVCICTLINLLWNN